jgi:hypothetical protein
MGIKRLRKKAEDIHVGTHSEEAVGKLSVVQYNRQSSKKIKKY